MIYIPSFIKIGSAVQKLMGRIHKQTHRQEGDLISLLLFFQNKESRLKMKCYPKIKLFNAIAFFIVYLTTLSEPPKNIVFNGWMIRGECIGQDMI
jgi:hypothetical protein